MSLGSRRQAAVTATGEGRALPDPSGSYRIEMTLPNGQVATSSFGLKP